MRAYLVSRYKSALRAGEAAEPALGDRDVIVDIHAAGVNLLDAKVRDGELKLILPYKAPFVLTKLIDSGRLRPIVDRTYPFDEAPQALAHVEGGRSKGKVVLTMV